MSTRRVRFYGPNRLRSTARLPIRLLSLRGCVSMRIYEVRTSDAKRGVLLGLLSLLMLMRRYWTTVVFRQSWYYVDCLIAQKPGMTGVNVPTRVRCRVRSISLLTRRDLA